MEIPINRVKLGEVTGLPGPQANTVYLVSLIVAQAVKRSDVLTVDDTINQAMDSLWPGEE